MAITVPETLLFNILIQKKRLQDSSQYYRNEAYTVL